MTDAKRTNKFEQHLRTLFWKSYLQRQRRWRLLLLEAGFAAIMFTFSILTAKPVFLTPLRAVPTAPLVAADIIASLGTDNIVGYAPDIPPYTSVMATVSNRLGINIMSASAEDDLNMKLYNMSQGTPLRKPVIWILWKPTAQNIWQFVIRSTERARSFTSSEYRRSNPHLRSGFLAVQLAVSEAILSYVSWKPLNYEIRLESMPVSPLMQQTLVQRAIATILLFFILALLPPILETQAMVVTETTNQFKKSLRIRGMGYSTIYFGWFTYAYLTALPVCVLACVTLIHMFRWVTLVYTMLIVLAYVTVMIMLAMIMALFTERAWIACTWTTLFTLLQLFVAQLIIHHQLDGKHAVLTFVLHLVVPPLGLEHAFSEFALVQMGPDEFWKGHSLLYTIVLWFIMIVFYFGILTLLQRTLKGVAIGGQVPWRSIIFKKVEHPNELHPIEIPSGKERDHLQEVDEFVAKAISLRNVSKSIMGEPILNNVTMDIYRGELTMLYAKGYQAEVIDTLEDLLIGITFPDSGIVNVLGTELQPGVNLLSSPYMMGYCHSCAFLLDDLTVQEHIALFCSICLTNESSTYLSEYCDLRSQRLLRDCDLKSVQHEYIRDLHLYYRTQLCWAIALLMEPRVVIIENYSKNPTYRSVIRDKIMEYRGYITIIRRANTSISLEYADRVFIFDNKFLVFGGTPAYMFFKYGREYRLRISLHLEKTNDGTMQELLEEASKVNATVRAYLGSMLILRLPTMPTTNVAGFIRYLNNNMRRLGMESMTITVPDSEEVCSRVILEARSILHKSELEHDISKIALKKLAKPLPWRRQRSCWSGCRNFKYIARKFFAFHTNNFLYAFITVTAAVIAGIFIGLSLAEVLADLEKNEATKKILHGELLTVEELTQDTTLILRVDNSSDAQSIATAYVMSETNATWKQIKRMKYTALSKTEKLTEYLVTRAIDSPQHYVFDFAYGMDVSVDKGKIYIRVLYSPLHQDAGAAARSLARAFVALIRHSTGALDASIRVHDDPLALDLSVWLYEERTTAAPIFVHFLLILTISQITLLPSKESGFIRHTQSHALNCSPLCYWMSLYLCDLLQYCALVLVMSASMVAMMVLVAPSTFHYIELGTIPLLLTIYGASCIPQAYLFSLGPQVGFNTMMFMLVNILFGETTVVAKILYGEALHYVLLLINISPQFNMGYALVRVRKIFLYNSECILFERKNLCSLKMLHKCCPRCGVLEECFSSRQYLTKDGVLMAIIGMASMAFIFMMLLLVLQYKYIQIFWKYISSKLVIDYEKVYEPENVGAFREKLNVIHKRNDIYTRQKLLSHTFGDYLLAYNISQMEYNSFSIRNVYLGLRGGEALAISGLKVHGRERLCHILAGYKLPSAGKVWFKSRWSTSTDHHEYARHISFCGEQDTLPPWMTVYGGLEMLAVLRGVPGAHVREEVMNYIDALELHVYMYTLVERVPSIYRMRLHFAAAVVGAPPIVVLDECTAYQKYSIRRAMYSIMYNLKKRGHAIIISSVSVESHMPVMNRLVILLEGRIYDVDQVDNLIERYCAKGYTVVVHLKDEVDVRAMFSAHFSHFSINDMSEVLVNVQIEDFGLNWATLFEKMEKLQSENSQVYSYIVSSTPIDSIYNSILQDKVGQFIIKEKRCFLKKCLTPHKKMISPSEETLSNLRTFEEQYSITKLKRLPWSVIFQR